jgi:hypothetical protein
MQGVNIHGGYLDEQVTAYMGSALNGSYAASLTPGQETAVQKLVKDDMVKYHAAIDKDGRMHVDLAGEDVVVDKSFMEYLENKPIIDANKVSIPITGGRGFGKSKALHEAVEKYKELQWNNKGHDPLEDLKKMAEYYGNFPAVDVNATQGVPYHPGGVVSGPSQGLMQVLPTTFSSYQSPGDGPLTEEEKLKIHQRTEKSEQAKRSRDPRYWAHNAEDKINGVLVQCRNNLGPAHQTTILLSAMSDALSDHIFQLGGE